MTPLWHTTLKTPLKSTFIPLIVKSDFSPFAVVKHSILFCLSRLSDRVLSVENMSFPSAAVRPDVRPDVGVTYEGAAAEARL